MLHLWNTRARALEPFEPLHPPVVGLYTCGPTVYNPLQLGNWRKYLCDDTLRRTLAFFGYQVTHVTNVTDVGHLVGDADDGDDKVEREALKTGKTAWEIARFYETSFVEGMAALHILPPTAMPRATEHIPEQIALVEILERKGFTYRLSDGIYFDTARFPGYGALSGQRLDEKETGARIETNQGKRQPADFALWKFSPAGQRRHMEWPSPWGTGFPGWHLECSAMSAKYLGQPFDIHTGGVDHIAVHHENEIAQSEAAHGKPLARYWLHDEFLLVDGGRMGKSLGNGYTLEDLAARGFAPTDYRWFVLGAHYRSKLNFTWEALEAARQALAKLRAAFVDWPAVEGAEPLAEASTAFREALADDVNLPKAVAVLWETVKSAAPPERKRATLLEMDRIFGLGMETWHPETFVVPDAIQALAATRWQARQAKDWSESDRLRQALIAAGWEMRDGPDTYELRPIKR